MLNVRQSRSRHERLCQAKRHNTPSADRLVPKTQRMLSSDDTSCSWKSHASQLVTAFKHINRLCGFYDECKRRPNVHLWMTFCDC
ncbi:hypothetical protein C5167_004539 [Papaver somniferum]|uniref:Uncharacterized protein n=1 Tax=Papaver somniferum TaxID=3469 RepID=A0A4Y7JB55_PAPSO|nr:hypothetical protein C5167_004539 [Papaver somniferum]